MNRVVVIGCPGAGKTYFSRELARKTDLRVIHMDGYFHEEDKDYLNNREAWREKVRELAKDDKWIMEGNYKSDTFDIRFPVADVIIHMDFPRYITVPRVLKRRVQYRNKHREEMPDTWVEKIDPAFFKYVLRYHKADRPDVLRRLKEYPDKRVVTLKSPRAARRYLGSQ